MSARVELIDVRREEREHFLDTFQRYWAELESHQDVHEPLLRSDYARFMEEARDTRFAWVRVNGEPAGFCVYKLISHWYRPGVREGYIDEMFIEPRFRRGGIAADVARQMIAELRAQGVTDIRLHVLPRNKGAQRLWERAGFQLEILQYRLTAPRP